MKKYRALKLVNRYLTTRNFRCHRRRVFFESLFESLKEVKDKSGNRISGYVKYDESSFTRACHEMAAKISFYPFEERSYINVGKFFIEQRVQPLYTQLKVRIIRKSSLWSFISGFGNYEVYVYGSDGKGNPIDFTYTTRVAIF